MKIGIGTTSKLKIEALQDALSKMKIRAEIISEKIDSGVSNQPFGFEEIMNGARTRAKGAMEKLDADIGVGMENGLVKIGENYFDLANIYVISKEEGSSAFSPGLLMPEWIIRKIKEENTEVGEITKKLSGDEEKDGFKYFTNGVITRKEGLSQAIIFAFAKIINKEKYVKQ